MWGEHGPDEKVFCVLVSDPNWNHISDICDVPPHLLKETEHFFSVYKELEEKKTGMEGWSGVRISIKIIEESQQKYQE